MAISKQANKQTYTHILECSHASVGLTQARPNYTVESTKMMPKICPPLPPSPPSTLRREWGGRICLNIKLVLHVRPRPFQCYLHTRLTTVMTAVKNGSFTEYVLGKSVALVLILSWVITISIIPCVNLPICTRVEAASGSLAHSFSPPNKRNCSIVEVRVTTVSVWSHRHPRSCGS